MKLVGLTGGIASGKSTAAAILRQLGAPVIDADQVAREVVEPGTPALAEIGRRWPQVISGGRLDRQALGRIVFADPEARAALEAITHPRIAAEVARRTAELETRGVRRVVYEAALIVEKGLDRGMDALIVVTAPEEAQLRRLLDREGLSEPEARQRLASQAPLAKKLARATFVIDNSGDLGTLRARTREVWAEVERRF